MQATSSTTDYGQSMYIYTWACTYGSYGYAHVIAKALGVSGISPHPYLLIPVSLLLVLPWLPPFNYQLAIIYNKSRFSLVSILRILYSLNTRQRYNIILKKPNSAPVATEFTDGRLQISINGYHGQMTQSNTL